MTKTTPKTTPLPIRFPVELILQVEDDAKALRRSKASIVIEIVERYYGNGGRHITPTKPKKKVSKP